MYEFNRSKETAEFNRLMIGWCRFLLWTWQNADARAFPTTWALLVNSAPRHEETSPLAGALHAHRMTLCLQWCTLYWHINYYAPRKCVCNRASIEPWVWLNQDVSSHVSGGIIKLRSETWVSRNCPRTGNRNRNAVSTKRRWWPHRVALHNTSRAVQIFCIIRSNANFIAGSQIPSLQVRLT